MPLHRGGALFVLLSLTLTLQCATSLAPPPPPHLVFVFLDDYGFANIGYHSSTPNETQTPVMDALVAEGVILDRHHVFKYCSPSRSAFHTGRNPIHVNVLNSKLDQHNPNDPVSGFMGIPRNMTTLPRKLKEAGYATHHRGKWHCGMATPDHTPLGRGYDTSLGYFCGSNDYWSNQGYETSCGADSNRDLWLNAGPAHGLNNSWACNQNNQAPGCVYEDQLFTDSMVQAIEAHNPATPFFGYMAFHNVHAPLEVPAAQEKKFSFIPFPDRKNYAAMVNLMDFNLGRLVASLKAKGMWNTTLLVAASDNGGPLGSGNNYPLRGAKLSNWQGGTRGNAFVSGGYLPSTQWGKVLEGAVACEDWYTTFCAIAKVDPRDVPGEASGLPPVDGLDVGPYILGYSPTSPRTELWSGHALGGDSFSVGAASVQGFTDTVSGFELLVGVVANDCTTGPAYPNASSSSLPCGPRDCGFPDAPAPSGARGCLFNLVADPTQSQDVALDNPGVVQDLYRRLKAVNDTAFNPDRGGSDPQACAVFRAMGGFVGPFLP